MKHWRWKEKQLIKKLMNENDGRVKAEYLVCLDIEAESHNNRLSRTRIIKKWYDIFFSRYVYNLKILDDSLAWFFMNGDFLLDDILTFDHMEKSIFFPAPEAVRGFIKISPL